jgi:hypothetical protein
MFSNKRQFRHTAISQSFFFNKDSKRLRLYKLQEKAKEFVYIHKTKKTYLYQPSKAMNGHDFVVLPVLPSLSGNIFIQIKNIKFLMQNNNKHE